MMKKNDEDGKKAQKPKGGIISQSYSEVAKPKRGSSVSFSEAGKAVRGPSGSFSGAGKPIRGASVSFSDAGKPIRGPSGSYSEAGKQKAWTTQSYSGVGKPKGVDSEGFNEDGKPKAGISRSNSGLGRPKRGASRSYSEAGKLGTFQSIREEGKSRERAGSKNEVQPNPRLFTTDMRKKSSQISNSAYLRYAALPQQLKYRLNQNMAMAIFVITIGSSYQFGYNVGVLNTPEVLIREFFNETYTHRNGYVSEKALVFMTSLTTAVFFTGGIVGACMAGVLANKMGRRRSILLSQIFLLSGAIVGSGCVWLKAPELLLLGRTLVGVHSGIGNCVAPMYLTEIAPFNLRGALGTFHQLAITFGIFMSSVYGLDMFLGQTNKWPFLLLLEVIPAAISILVLSFLPDSPRYLLLFKKERKMAETALQFYRQKTNVSSDLMEMDTENQMNKQGNTRSNREESFSLNQLLSDKQLRKPLFIACFLQVIQQFSGINAIFFFSNSIFRESGVPDSQVEYAVLGTTAVNLLMTFIAIPLIDKVGRRPLLLIPMIVMVFDLLLLTLSQILQDESQALSYVSVVCVLVYVICFAVGLGPIPLMIGSELFCQGPRTVAMAVISVANWMCTLVIALSFESIQDVTKRYTFFIFLVLMVLFTVFVYFQVPETKNKTFEQIAGEFATPQISSVQSEEKVESPHHHLYILKKNSSMIYDIDI